MCLGCLPRNGAAKLRRLGCCISIARSAVNRTASRGAGETTTVVALANLVTNSVTPIERRPIAIAHTAPLPCRHAQLAGLPGLCLQLCTGAACSLWMHALRWPQHQRRLWVLHCINQLAHSIGDAQLNWGCVLLARSMPLSRCSSQPLCLHPSIHPSRCWWRSRIPCASRRRQPGPCARRWRWA